MLRKGGRLKVRNKSPEEVEQNKADTEKMWNLFEQHWLVKTKQGGKHYCESCQEPIYGENKSLYHDHLLEKGNPRYEHLKYELGNLFLCCWSCHDNKGRGYGSDKHKQAIEQAKVRFNVQ